MTDNNINAAFISISILTGALIIALIVAKIFDYIYDRTSLRDDASDISEHTRALIRARLAVMKFMKPKPTTGKNKEEKAKETARHVFRIWSAKSARSRQARLRRAQEANAKDKDSEEGKASPTKVTTITFVNEESNGSSGGAGGKKGGGDKQKKGNLLVIPTVKVSDTTLSPTDGEVRSNAKTQSSTSSPPAPPPAAPGSASSKNAAAKKTCTVAPAPVTVVAASTGTKAADQAKTEQAKADKAKEEKAKEEKAKEEKAKEEKAKEEKAKEEKAKEEKAKEQKAKEEKSQEKAKEDKGKEEKSKPETAKGEATKVEPTKRETTSTVAKADGGKAVSRDAAQATRAASSKPLKKFEVERITGVKSPPKSAGAKVAGGRSFVTSPVEHLGDRPVESPMSLSNPTPSTSRTAKEVLVNLREELRDQGKDPGVSFMAFRDNTDDLLLPVHEDNSSSTKKTEKKEHDAVSRTSSADYEFLTETSKDKDKVKAKVDDKGKANVPKKTLP